MSTRRASWLAWSLAAAGLALVAINSGAVGSDTAMIVLYGSCAVIGALAVSRQPCNLVGWLFLAAGVAAALQILPGELAVFIYRHGGPLLAVQWLAWPENWGWILTGTALLTLLPLLFPDGRLPSRRWRPLAWLAVGWITFLAVAFDIEPGNFGEPPVENPAGIGASGWSASLLANLALFAVASSCVLCVCSLFFRYRRADGVERQQIKWFG